MAMPNNEELADLMLAHCRDLMDPDPDVSNEELKAEILDGLNSADEPAAILMQRMARALYARGTADGWQAALDCHSQHGMAGWSTHRDEFLKGSMG